MFSKTAINNERQELLPGHNWDTIKSFLGLGLIALAVFTRGLLHLLHADAADTFLMIPNTYWMFAELLSPLYLIKVTALPFR